MRVLASVDLNSFQSRLVLIPSAATHEVDVSLGNVYKRLVENGQGGTWCCGHNGLLLGMLRALGYRCVSSDVFALLLNRNCRTELMVPPVESSGQLQQQNL